MTTRALPVSGTTATQDTLRVNLILLLVTFRHPWGYLPSRRVSRYLAGTKLSRGTSHVKLNNMTVKQPIESNRAFAAMCVYLIIWIPAYHIYPAPLHDIQHYCMHWKLLASRDKNVEFLIVCRTVVFSSASKIH